MWKNLNAIMRKAFPFLERILLPSDNIDACVILDSLPPNLLFEGSHEIKIAEGRTTVQRRIYIMDNENIIACVPDAKILEEKPEVKSPDGSISAYAFFLGYSELLFKTIQNNLDTDIRFIVILEARSRVEGFEKCMENCKIEIFEIDTDSIEDDCKKAETEAALRQSGKRRIDLN